MKNTLFLLFCILVSTNLPAQKALYSDKNQPLEARVNDALSRMTLEEKVAICHAQSKFSIPGVPRLGIPEIWMSDGPHGVREEIGWDTWSPAGWTNDSCTAFPALTCLAATFNPELAGKYGVAIGEEARFRKKDVLLGPGVNIYRTPLNGRNFEYMGEDPFLASSMVVPYIQGVQKCGVAACVKHFALNNQETDRDKVNVEISERALQEIYLPAFKAAVKEAGVWAVMGSYNQLRGQHCCHNDYLLNTVLKGKWGFDGVVISDWGGTHDTRQAACNGLDIEMGTYTNGLSSASRFGYEDYYLGKPFLSLIKNKEIPVEVLDGKARRILRLNMRTSLMNDRPLGRFGCKDHSQVAREIASEGIVLLKNKHGLLPVAPGKCSKIAVIGENAVRRLTLGGGSSELKTKYEISPLAALEEMYGKDVVVYSRGYSSGRPDYGKVHAAPEKADSLLLAAVDAAKNADVVFFIGGLNKNYQQDSEGGDRTTMDLPFNQNELIQALVRVNPRTAVILLSGNAVTMPWLADVPVVVQGWYNGSESGHALADVLSGAVNPSGKLPFTFPCKLEDNAAHFYGKNSYPGVNGTQEYKEGILVGYRWHEARRIEPLFPFGFGLSYTSFNLSGLKSNQPVYVAGDTIKVAVTLKNTGLQAGSEVVQLYIGKEKSAVPRAVKELKAFRKVRLAAGERRVITLNVPVSELSFYDEGIKDWRIENGTYLLSVGNSSQTIAERQKIQIQ